MRRHSLAGGTICLVILIAATACGQFGITPVEQGSPGAPPSGAGQSQDPTAPPPAPSGIPSSNAGDGFCANHEDAVFCADFESGKLDESGFTLDDELDAEPSIVQLPNRGRVLKLRVPLRPKGSAGSAILTHDLGPAWHGVTYDASFSFYVDRISLESAGVGMLRFLGDPFAFHPGVASFEEGAQLNSIAKDGASIPMAPNRWRTARIRVVADDKYATSTVTIDDVLVSNETTASFDRASDSHIALGAFFTSAPNHAGAAEIYFDDVLVTIAGSPNPTP